MPFEYQSPLNYPANSASSIRRFKYTRVPTVTDYRNFIVGDMWLDQSSNDWYICCYKDSTSAIWRRVAGTGAPAESFLPDSGTSPVIPNAANEVTITGGTGINTVGGLNTITFNSTGGGITWNRVAGPAVALAVDNGYIPTNAALVTLTLPAAAVVGNIIEICGEGAGMFSIAQNAGQSIQFGNLTTTVGVGGSLQATNRYDTVKLVCRVANTTWAVLSNVGILNVV